MISNTTLKALPSFQTSAEIISQEGRYVYLDQDFLPFTKLGDRANFFAMADILAGVGLEENSQLGLVCHLLDAPSRLHYHDYLEICFVASGRLIHIINQQPNVLSAGDFCIISEKAEHLLAPLEDNKPLVVDFLIHPNLLNSIRLYSKKTTFLEKAGHFSLTAGNELALQHFFTIYNRYQHRDNLAVIGSFLEFLYNLQEQEKDSQTDTTDKLTKACLTLIQQNISLITQKQLAEEMNYSASYLSRHIKKTTGKTISQLITDEKLRLAQNLLANSETAITEISSMIGYASESHFFRLFKEHYDITPKHYRDLMRR